MIVWMPWNKFQHGLFQPVATGISKQLHIATPLQHLNDENNNNKYHRTIHTNHRSNKLIRSLSPVDHHPIHTSSTTTQQLQSTSNDTSDTIQSTGTNDTDNTTTSQLHTVPYNIHRTSSHQLPIYTDYKRGNHITTILRRVSGDQLALYHEIRLLLGPHVNVENRHGKIVIDGQHTQILKTWLQKLGF